MNLGVIVALAAIAQTCGAGSWFCGDQTKVRRSLAVEHVYVVDESMDVDSKDSRQQMGDLFIGDGVFAFGCHPQELPRMDGGFRPLGLIKGWGWKISGGWKGCNIYLTRYHHLIGGSLSGVLYPQIDWQDNVTTYFNSAFLSYCNVHVSAQLPLGGEFSADDQSLRGLPQSGGEQGDEERKDESERPLVFVDGFHSAGGVQLEPSDRFDAYGEVFVKSAIGFVVLVVVYAILEML